MSIDEIKQYSEIFITGGEPMLYPAALLAFVMGLKTNENKIYLYTALPYPKPVFLNILDVLDGCTITIHSLADRAKFIEAGYGEMVFNEQMYYGSKSMWLNVFPKANIPLSSSWNCRQKQWIKDAPLPDGEDFVRPLVELNQ